MISSLIILKLLLSSIVFAFDILCALIIIIKKKYWKEVVFLLITAIFICDVSVLGANIFYTIPSEMIGQALYGNFLFVTYKSLQKGKIAPQFSGAEKNPQFPLASLIYANYDVEYPQLVPLKN